MVNQSTQTCFSWLKIQLTNQLINLHLDVIASETFSINNPPFWWMASGKWIAPARDPKLFQTVQNGQTLNIAVISSTLSKGSIIYNMIDGSPPTSIAITWDTVTNIL